MDAVSPAECMAKAQDLKEKWDNGNRKDVVRELARSERDVVFSFTMLLEGLTDRATFAVLALGYTPGLGEGWR